MCHWDILLRYFNKMFTVLLQSTQVAVHSAKRWLTVLCDSICRRYYALLWLFGQCKHVLQRQTFKQITHTHKMKVKRVCKWPEYYILPDKLTNYSNVQVHVSCIFWSDSCSLWCLRQGLRIYSGHPGTHCVDCVGLEISKCICIPCVGITIMNHHACPTFLDNFLLLFLFCLWRQDFTLLPNYPKFHNVD